MQLQIIPISVKAVEEPLQKKIIKLKAHNSDYQWLDALNQLFESVFETFESVRCLHEFAVKTFHKMQTKKRIVNGCVYQIPENDTFEAIKINLNELYETSTLGMIYTKGWFDEKSKTLMSAIDELNSYPGQYFQHELLFVHAAFVKLSARNEFLTAMKSNIKLNIYEDYVQKAIKLLDDERNVDVNTEIYLQNVFEKKFSKYNSFLSFLERGLTSIITQQVGFAKELNELFGIQIEASTSIKKPFDIRIVSQSISMLGEKIILAEGTKPAAKSYQLLLSQLRKFLWKMFNIYVIVNDVHSKCASLDPFNGTQNALNQEYQKIMTNKTNILSTGFKNILEKTQNSIFMAYEHIIKYLKEPSTSKKTEVVKALSKASRNSAEATNFAKKTHDGCKEIRDSFVAKKSNSNSIIETGLTAKLNKFNSRIEEMGKFIPEIMIKNEVTLKIFSNKLANIINLKSETERPISKLREKLIFIIDQNDRTIQFFEVLRLTFSEPIFEMKQIIKELDGVRISIPPKYIFDTLNNDRIEIAREFKEIGNSLSVIGKRYSEYVLTKVVKDYQLWEQLNEPQWSDKLSNTVDELNKIYKDMVNIFREMHKSKYEHNLMSGQIVVMELNFVPEITPLHYVEANIHLECEIFPNLRKSLEIIDTAKENIKKKAKEIEVVLHNLMDDVFDDVRTNGEH